MAVTKLATSSVSSFAKYNTASAGFESDTGPGQWVATCGNSTTYYTSPDGFTWTARTLPSNPGVYNYIRGVGGEYKIYGEQADLTSTDGLSWKSYLKFFSASRQRGISKSTKDTYRVGYQVSNYDSVFDPTINSFAVVDTSTSYANGDVELFNGSLVVSQNGGSQRISHSSDGGQTWTRVDAISYSANQGQMTAVVTDGSIVVAAFSGSNTNYGIWSSTNLNTWTKRVSVSSAVMTLSYANGRFWWGGDSGQLRYSTNGISWTAVSSALSGGVRGVDWNGSVYTAVSDGGWISTSADGTTWTTRATGLISLRDVVYH